MKKNKNSFLKKIIGICIIPLGTLCIMLAISAAKGTILFESEGSYIAFFRAVASVMLTTFALSINLNSGRFDFSIGSIALLSSVISATVCMKYDFSWGIMLVISLMFGIMLGAISGMVYVLVKLPPIIVSLAVTLFFEGLAFAVTSGYGVSFVSNLKLTSFPDVLNYGLLIVGGLVAIILLFDHTKFGYDYNALLSGQKVAVNIGIGEKRNAVICYLISGGLMGVVGFISATNTGNIQVSLNFSSIAVMFTAFLPMFIGGFIGRFCNIKIGYVLGAVSTALLSLTYARLNVASSVQQIVTAFVLVLFLIYLNNEHKILSKFLAHKK